MANTYMTGYAGTVRSRESLLSWSEWQNLDPEMQRRTLALLDASIAAGRPLGIGDIYRSTQQQLDLFLSRHYVVVSGGCCGYGGKRYQLRSGMAHAAPPGKSYHEPTLNGKALAIDFIGNLDYLKANADAYGMVHFANVNNEPWHGQPKEIPTSRSQYDGRPLKVWPIPGLPAEQPTQLFAPKPTIRQGAVNIAAEVRALQGQCNFWGWRDAYGQMLLVDGDFGAKSAQAVMSMQRALKLTVDGVYGPKSYYALQAFLNAMVAYSNG